MVRRRLPLGGFWSSCGRGLASQENPEPVIETHAPSPGGRGWGGGCTGFWLVDGAPPRPPPTVAPHRPSFTEDLALGTEPLTHGRR